MHNQKFIKHYLEDLLLDSVDDVPNKIEAERVLNIYRQRLMVHGDRGDYKGEFNDAKSLAKNYFEGNELNYHFSHLKYSRTIGRNQVPRA